MADSMVTLREATGNDAEVVHWMIRAIASHVGATGKVSSSAEDIRRFGFSDPPCFHAIIAERGETAVGLCLYFFSFSTWRGNRGVYVQDIYVAESERRTALARRLIAETARRAGDQGAKYLRLSVDMNNLVARRFYEKIGLELAQEECIYMALGESFESLKSLE